jgi:hypothetical protein
MFHVHVNVYTIDWTRLPTYIDVSSSCFPSEVFHVEVHPILILAKKVEASEASISAPHITPGLPHMMSTLKSEGLILSFVVYNSKNLSNPELEQTDAEVKCSSFIFLHCLKHDHQVTINIITKLLVSAKYLHDLHCNTPQIQ